MQLIAKGQVTISICEINVDLEFIMYPPPPLFNEIPDPTVKVYPKREYNAKSNVKPFSIPNFINRSQNK